MCCRPPWQPPLPVSTRRKQTDRSPSCGNRIPYQMKMRPKRTDWPRGICGACVFGSCAARRTFGKQYNRWRRPGAKGGEGSRQKADTAGAGLPSPAIVPWCRYGAASAARTMNGCGGAKRSHAEKLDGGCFRCRSLAELSRLPFHQQWMKTPTPGFSRDPLWFMGNPHERLACSPARKDRCQQYGQAAPTRARQRPTFPEGHCPVGRLRA